MKQLSFFLPNFNKIIPSNKGPRSARAEVLGRFLLRLNPGRMESGRKELTPAFLGSHLSYLSVKDLNYLYSICDKADNFSKMFWWQIRKNP